MFYRLPAISHYTPSIVVFSAKKENLKSDAPLKQVTLHPPKSNAALSASTLSAFAAHIINKSGHKRSTPTPFSDDAKEKSESQQFEGGGDSFDADRLSQASFRHMLAAKRKAGLKFLMFKLQRALLAFFHYLSLPNNQLTRDQVLGVTPFETPKSYSRNKKTDVYL